MLGRLAPDHKTIAEFRRGETKAIVAAAAAFVQFAQSHRLIAGNTIAIDGSKIRAVASNKAALDKKSLLARDQAIEQEIQRYQDEQRHQIKHNISVHGSLQPADRAAGAVGAAYLVARQLTSGMVELSGQCPPPRRPGIGRNDPQRRLWTGLHDQRADRSP